MNKVEKIIWALIMLEIIVSIYLVYFSYTNSDFCPLNLNCREVSLSEYSSIFGIKLSVLGVFAFSALLLIFIFIDYSPWMPKLFIFANIIGVLGALRLLYIQFFILNKLCFFCLITDFAMLILAPISIIYAKTKINKPPYF